MSVEIDEEETGSRIGFAFVARCDGKVCGRIKAHRTKLAGKVVYKVDRVDVDEAHRRRGVATKLYEAAHSEACRRRGRLASSERNPGAFSHNFWEKQAAKGRVEVKRVRGVEQPVFIIRDCSIRSLAGLRKRKGR